MAGICYLYSNTIVKTIFYKYAGYKYRITTRHELTKIIRTISQKRPFKTINTFNFKSLKQKYFISGIINHYTIPPLTPYSLPCVLNALSIIDINAIHSKIYTFVIQLNSSINKTYFKYPTDFIQYTPQAPIV